MSEHQTAYCTLKSTHNHAFYAICILYLINNIIICGSATPSNSFVFIIIIKDTVYFTSSSKQAKIMVNKNYLQVLIPCQTRQYRQHPYQQVPWLLLLGDAHLSKTAINKNK